MILIIRFSMFLSFFDPGLENESISSCDRLNNLFDFQKKNNSIRNAISHRYAQMQPPMKKFTKTRGRYARLGLFGALHNSNVSVKHYSMISSKLHPQWMSTTFVINLLISSNNENLHNDLANIHSYTFLFT